MYQKYHTEAIVLQSRELGEADRNFALYSRDFGLVRARASAVRSERSKMRYALQSYARANVSLVKGKRGWRTAGATALASVGRDPKGVAVFARISELTLRLIHGEEPNQYLFSALADAHEALTRAEVQAPATIELVCVARILYALGYLSTEALQTSLLTHTAYGMEHMLEAETMRDELLSSVNKAIAETQL